MELIEGLKWRYATKKFDSSKKVSKENWDKLKEAIQLSASSYGLQLYKVFIIKDEELRRKLQPAAYNQSQIIDADAVVVFCNYTAIPDDDINKFVQLMANTRNQSIDEVKGFGEYVKSTTLSLTKDQLTTWTAKQTYIALANLLAAGAELRIDVCPMEGFNSAEVNKVLGLDEKNLNAAVIATVGYRSTEDPLAGKTKVRKPIEELIELI